MDPYDRHEREARIAMVLVSLPLPPLPVVACRGERCTDGVCSSHDLHAVMMATDGQRAAQGAVTEAVQEDTRLRKCVLLNRMREKVQAALEKYHADPEAAEDAAYAAVCDGLRAYWGEYAHACSDVRVLGLDSVVRGDAVHVQMLAYSRAHVGVGEAAADAEDVSAALSYRALFAWWVRRAFV
jgi:hypothetical protein